VKAFSYKLHKAFPLLKKRYFDILGNQYSKDNFHDKSGFLAKARMHQSRYRAEMLKVPFDGFGNYLTKEDALKGLNFYNDFDIFSEVKSRYNKQYSKQLYANMLRSEHIAFNMFVPFKQNLLFGTQVLNQFLDNNILSIDKIEIEYAPSPSLEYLDDRTSFDVYMEYTHVDSSKSILGIEVKYTERDYKLKTDSRESRCANRKESRYYLVTKRCNLYKDNWINILPTDRYRQVWRNQLLGESMLLREPDKYNHFTSITIYPEGNQHFIEVSKEYISMLKKPERFVGITYENLFSSSEKYCPDDIFAKWIEYMRERYIIND